MYRKEEVVHKDQEQMVEIKTVSRKQLFTFILFFIILVGCLLAEPVSKFFGVGVFIAALAGVAAYPRELLFIIRSDNLFFILSAALILVCWASLSWTINVSETMISSIKLTLYAASGLVLLQVVTSIDRRDISAFFSFYIWAVSLGCLILLIDTHYNHLFFRLIRGLDVSVKVNEHSANPGVAILTVLFWPIAYILYARGKTAYIWILTLFAGLAVFSSTGQAAQIGFIVGTLVLTFARLIPKRYVFAGFAAVWSIGMALTPWILQALFYLKPRFFFLPSMEASGGHRLDIWNSLSSEVFDQFWLGHGLGATKFLDLKTSGLFYPLQWVMHPHNMPLELWVNFGLLGVFLGTLIPVTMMAAISRLEGWGYTVALSSFAATLTILLAGHGTWQSWWVGTLVIALFMNKLIKQNVEVGPK
jgi:O-antigen ligase